jgi:tetratricopeptide (TPR) repeat protein
MQLTKAENLRQAQQLIDQGRVSSALKIYQKIVDDDPSDLNAISTLGDLYVKAGRTSDAVEHFLRIADNYLRGGSAKSAAYILNKVFKLDPANPAALMNMGELRLRNKEIVPAHDDFIEAGAAFWRKGDITAAIGMNQRALEIVPDSRHAKAALAFIQREMDQSAQPEPKKKKKEITLDLPPIIISIADGSDEVCAPLTFSESQLNSNSTSDVDDLPSQREFLPGRDEDAIFKQIAVAEFLVGCGDVDQAIGVLRESLLDKPDHIQTREKLKDIYLRSEMIDRASEECVNRAAIYLARGETSRAAEYVTRARLLSPALEPVSALAASQPGGIEESQGIQETGEPRPEDRQPARVM